MINQIDIQKTSFESNYYSSIDEDELYCEFSGVNFLNDDEKKDIFNEIEIEGAAFLAVYYAIEYINENGDEDLNMMLSEIGGTDNLLLKIGELKEDKIINLNEEEKEKLVCEIKHYFNKIDSINCIISIVRALDENKVNALSEILSFDL